MEGTQRVPDASDAACRTTSAAPPVGGSAPPPSAVKPSPPGEELLHTQQAQTQEPHKHAQAQAHDVPVPVSPCCAGVAPEAPPLHAEASSSSATAPTPSSSSSFTPVCVAHSDGGSGCELLACPICCTALSEPFMTTCGHTFCHACISAHLQRSDACPMCRQHVAEAELRPNHVLRDLVAAADSTPRGRTPSPVRPQPLRAPTAPTPLEALAEQAGKLDEGDVETLLRTLQERRQAVREDSRLVRHAVLVEFLERLRDRKLALMAELREQVELVEADLSEVTRVRAGSPVLPTGGGSGSGRGGGGARGKRASPSAMLRELASGKRQRVAQLLPHLEADYFTRRHAEPSLTPFASDLCSFAQVRSLRVVSHVTRAPPPPPPAADKGEQGNRTITSIRFDKEARVFATAGVRRAIKVYDFDAVLNERVARHYPVMQLETEAGVSALCWSPYIRAHLTSCDYLGNMHLWNTHTGQLARQYVARQRRRVWAVDISRADPMSLASASADGVVCLWHAHHSRPVAELAMPTKAHVCGVSFHPSNATQLLCASADHVVRLFDLRHVAKPLHEYMGHAKAVSDVRWTGEHEFVTASTDSTIRVWETRANTCVRVHGGHRNDRHFVGLDECNGLLACGSETNEAHVYTRGLRTPLLSHALAPPPPATTPARRPFVSVVCWHPHTRHLLVGNSVGSVQVLRME